MQIVYMPGVWDLLHVGHIRALTRAKSLGDILVVGVPSDGVVLEDKNRLPIIPMIQRIEMIKALRIVDTAMPYFKLEFLSHLRYFNPAVLAVGQTWGLDVRHLDAELWVERHKRELVKIPYTRTISTTEIRRRIRIAT